jgi:hypothetical protein
MAEKMTIEQFGAQIKSKYPDYAQVPDAEIGNRMLQKYPVYADRVQSAVSPQPVSQETPQSSSTLGRVAGAVGNFGVGVAKGLGSTVFGIGQLADKVIPGQLLPEEKPEFLKPKGTAQNIGFGAEQIGEFFIPAGLAVKGAKAIEGASALSKLSKAGKAGKIASGALKLGGKAAIGATEAGAVRAAQTGGDIEEVKTAAKFGAAAPFVAAGVGKAVTGLAKRTPTNRLQEMTRNIRSLQNAYEEGTKRVKVNGVWTEKSNPIKTLGERKLVPEVVDAKVDTTNILGKLREELDSLAKPRSTSLSSSRKTIAFNDFKKSVVKTIQSSQELKNSGMVGTTMKKADSILKDFRTSFGQRITLDTLDNIRLTMNKRYDPELRDVFRAIGDAARKHVYHLDPASRTILEKEGEILSAIRFAEALQGRAVKGGRVGGYVSSILGSIVGASTQVPVAGPIVGALGGRALDRAIRNLYFKAPGAQTAQSLINIGKRVSNFGTPK